MSVFESLVKECMEEASIGPDIVRQYARAAGSISYFFRSIQRLRVGFNLRLNMFTISSFPPGH
ncbi:hypothetical protein BYT27DRAFT_6448801 [Phlegmacium glaucopus]|nr:hypothetical protein BYT27DRAFT_6448801 [Phlegmacium glaucopus]